MSIEKITADEIYAASMERLANYPTAASRYGTGGMTDKELKARYDKLAKLAIAKLNELIGTIGAGNDGTSALLRELITPITDEEGESLTLCEVLEDVTDGSMAGYLGLDGLQGDNLADELRQLEALIESKVSKESGKGLSTNDFTDRLKSELAANTANRHAHSNKDVLDQTTAAYTIEEKSRLADNTEARHTHGNKGVLDRVTAPYTIEEASKLANIEAGAQVNPAIVDDLLSSDASKVLSARQGSLLQTMVDSKQPAGDYATLVDGKVPAAQLPSYVDDVIDGKLATFPVPGESGKIYVDTDTGKTYRWSGSAYVEISASLALGETSSTAYPGDKGAAAAARAEEAYNIASYARLVAVTAYENVETVDTKANAAATRADEAYELAEEAVAAAETMSPRIYDEDEQKYYSYQINVKNGYPVLVMSEINES